MIYLVAGHSNVKGRDNGAEGNGVIEGMEAARLVEDLSLQMRIRQVPHYVDSYSRVTAETIAYLQDKVKPNDVVIDVHFNSAESNKATGVEVLIRDKNNKILEATAFGISAIIAKTIGIANRGVKTEVDSARGKLGMLNLNCNAMIVEICFLSNADDVAKYEKNYIQVVGQLAKYLNTI